MRAGEVPVSAGVAGHLTVLLDAEDAERLGGRKLSLGSHGYAQLWDAKRMTLLHRWVMGAERGDRRIVDHISGDRLDNRKANLRFVTASESSANTKTRSASGYRGVHLVRSRWAATAQVRGRQFHLGTYDTPEEAAQVSHEWRLVNLPGYTAR